MASSETKSSSCGTVYNPPGSGPWRISARMTTYRAFRLIYKDVDEKAVREFVKRYVKGGGDWFAEGKKSKDWKKEMIMLGDKMAAKYWPDLQDKDYLYYALEQYLVLIRLHAKKYDMRRKARIKIVKAHDLDNAGECEGEDTGSVEALHDALDPDETTELSSPSIVPTSPRPNSATLALETLTPNPTTPSPNFEIVAPLGSIDFDKVVKKLAVYVEERLKDRINSLVQKEAGKMEAQIQDAGVDVKDLKEDLRALTWKPKMTEDKPTEKRLKAK